MVISISIALAIFSTFVIISEFLEANIIITIDSVTSSLDKVVFPSIIMNNQNKVCFNNHPNVVELPGASLASGEVALTVV